MRKKIIRLTVAITTLAALGACTVVNTAVLPTDPASRAPFVTTGDIRGPYQSMGIVQVTRRGHLLFGFIDLVGTDLNVGFKEVLLPEVRHLGGDGIINVRFHQDQYLPATQVVQAIFFFIPFLWPAVTITGEVVRLAPGGTIGEPAPPVVR